MSSYDLPLFFQESIKNKLGWIEKSLAGLDQLDKDKATGVFYSIALNYREIAVDKLMLGERDEAVEWLKKSIRYYIKYVEAIRSNVSGYPWMDEADLCRDYFYTAILSGDEELIRRCAGLVLSIPDVYPAEKVKYSPKYLFTIALASFLTGAAEKARTMLKALDPAADEKAGISFGSVRINERKAYFEGLKACLGGLIDSDQPGFIHSLHVLLAYHDRHFAGDRSVDALISFDATALICIARGKGMTIEPENIPCLRQYIPWVLFDDGASSPVDYRKGLECTAFLIDEVAKRMDELVPEEAYGNMGRYARWAAIYSLLAGNKPEAMAWFKKSSGYYQEEVTLHRAKYSWKILSDWNGDAIGCINTLNMAILSGDKQSIDNGLRLSLDLLYGKWVAVGDRYAGFYYIKAFANYLSGNRDEAVKALETMIPKKIEMLGGIEDHYLGLKTSLQGLIGNNKEMLISGLNMILAHHDSCSLLASPDSLVSVDVAVLIRIAGEKGINIKQKDIREDLRKYIPWNLFE